MNPSSKPPFPCTIRPMHPTQDLGFITNSWLNSWYDSPYKFEVDETDFYAFHHDVVRRLIAQGRTLVACNPDDENEIYGYLCADSELRPPVLHFLYVRAKKRHRQIARRLVCEWLGTESRNVRIFYSHRTELGDAVAPHLFALAEHNPYLQFAPWPPTLKY